MSDPFLAEIRICGFNFAPRGWAFCSGQILPISQNTALFSLLGVNYGGNGMNTFALPNLQGQAIIGPGQGPGLSPYTIGQASGVSTVTLLETQLPAHTHTLNADATAGGVAAPATSVALGTASRGRPPVYATSSSPTALSPSSLTTSGGSQPHNNMSPYLALNFIIAMQGIFPPRP